MIIGEERAVDELWERSGRGCHGRATTGPASRSTRSTSRREPGDTGLRAATGDDFAAARSPPARPRTRRRSGSIRCARDPEGFRWRTRAQIEEGRSWLWVEDGTILFKAEASAWTPSAVQIQQVWVDPAGADRGYAQRGMRDLCRLLLERVPTVCLFVRPENAPAIRVYEAVGMQRHGSYRSLIF